MLQSAQARPPPDVCCRRRFGRRQVEATGAVLSSFAGEATGEAAWTCEGHPRGDWGHEGGFRPEQAANKQIAATARIFEARPAEAPCIIEVHPFKSRLEDRQPRITNNVGTETRL